MHSEVIIDTVTTISGYTTLEEVSYVEKEIFFVVDTAIVFDYDTNEETMSIIRSFLRPEDLIIKKE